MTSLNIDYMPTLMSKDFEGCPHHPGNMIPVTVIYMHKFCANCCKYTLMKKTDYIAVMLIALLCAMFFPIGLCALWMLPLAKKRVCATCNYTVGGKKAQTIYGCFIVAFILWVGFFVLAVIKLRDEYQKGESLEI